MRRCGCVQCVCRNRQRVMGRSILLTTWRFCVRLGRVDVNRMGACPPTNIWGGSILSEIHSGALENWFFRKGMPELGKYPEIFVKSEKSGKIWRNEPAFGALYVVVSPLEWLNRLDRGIHWWQKNTHRRLSGDYQARTNLSVSSPRDFLNRPPHELYRTTIGNLG